MRRGAGIARGLALALALPATAAAQDLVRAAKPTIEGLQRQAAAKRDELVRREAELGRITDVMIRYGLGLTAEIDELVALSPVERERPTADLEQSLAEELRAVAQAQTEFEAVAGHCGSDSVLVERAMSMAADLELGALLVTRSEKGMLLVERGCEPVFLSTQAREVYDVTGAGDTVLSARVGSVAPGRSTPSLRHW